MSGRTAIILGCAALAILAIVCIVAVVAGGLIGTLFLHVIEEPEGLWLTVEAPDAVKVGDTFKLVVRATNRLSDREIELGDLDIEDQYLDGFVIVSISPDPKSTELDTFNDCMAVRFAVTLPPGSTAEFEFELRAQRVGQYRGQVDQFVGLQFLSMVVQTTVTGDRDPEGIHSRSASNRAINRCPSGVQCPSSG